MCLCHGTGLSLDARVQRGGEGRRRSDISPPSLKGCREGGRFCLLFKKSTVDGTAYMNTEYEVMRFSRHTRVDEQLAS